MEVETHADGSLFVHFMMEPLSISLLIYKNHERAEKQATLYIFSLAGPPNLINLEH